MTVKFSNPTEFFRGRERKQHWVGFPVREEASEVEDADGEPSGVRPRGPGADAGGAGNTPSSGGGQGGHQRKDRRWVGVKKTQVVTT